MANGPLMVRGQLDAVVSSVPVKPVMSMLAIVVAAARVVVPGIPRTAKASSPADTGEIEMLGFAVVPLAVVPPAVGDVAKTPPKRTVAHTCFAVPLTSVAVMV